MKTLKRVAALSIVAGGFLVAGLAGSAEAGCHGGYCAPSYAAPAYGIAYHAPVIVNYPRVRIHCDAYGCHYFTDNYGIRHDVYATSFSNRYFYNHGGARRFVLGY